MRKVAPIHSLLSVMMTVLEESRPGRYNNSFWNEKQGFGFTGLCALYSLLLDKKIIYKEEMDAIKQLLSDNRPDTPTHGAYWFITPDINFELAKKERINFLKGLYEVERCKLKYR